jgi:hypothetical protein
MRRVLSTAFGSAFAGAVLLLGGGCTFLISFDDVPQTDAGAPLDASEDRADDDTGAPETVDDGGDERASPPAMPACDTSFPLDEVEGCAVFNEGAQACADNSSFSAYPGDRSKDVVTCSKSGATCVRHCAACAHNPSGFPDQCDQCAGKLNGTYCGTDMGWVSADFRLRVTCTDQRMSAVTACSARGCDSKGGTGSAACKP